MTELEGCIQFWKAKLAHDSYLMEPSVIVGIQNTIKYLEEAQKLREEVKQRPKAKLPETKSGKTILVERTLQNAGYNFEHPTLILEGQDGWFVILTPQHTPHQAIVHFDGRQADFFATVPELIE